MGPRAELPPLPDLEPNSLDDSVELLDAIQRECNWLQALEGDIDTSHFSFLHFGAQTVDQTRPGTFQYYALNDRAPRYSVLDTDYGAMYGAYRPADPGYLYWRIASFLFPFYAMIPPGVLGNQIVARAWACAGRGWGGSVQRRAPRGVSTAFGRRDPARGRRLGRSDRRATQGVRRSSGDRRGAGGARRRLSRWVRFPNGTETGSGFP